MRGVRNLFLLATLAAAQAAEIPEPRFTDPARLEKLRQAFPEVERIFERFWQRRGAPGAVFGVVIDGRLDLVRTYGVRDFESKAPVTPQSAFRIASMTKSFTALALLKLRDEGRLSLEDPVTRHVPEFDAVRLPTKDSAPIRIRQLINHTTGLPEDNPWGDQQLGVPSDELTKWLQQGLPFSTAPGTAYEYSNFGFALARRVIERVSGMSYRQYIEQRILAPLGMASSTLDPATVPAERRVTGYRKTGDSYSVEPSLPHGSFGAMGGMVTTAEDLGRYVAFHLAAYPPRDEADSGPVRRSSVREMQTLSRTSMLFNVERAGGAGRLEARSGGYGYGLTVSRDCRFDHVVGHGGGLPGWGSYMVWLPEYGVGLFSMMNLTYASPAPALMDAIEALSAKGGLAPRSMPASPALEVTRARLWSLWGNWSDSLAAELAAGNLFKDRSAEARRKELEDLKRDLGACREPGPVESLGRQSLRQDQPRDSALRGMFRMECEKGRLEAAFTLAPTTPPRVQQLTWTAVKPLSPAQRRGLDLITGATSSPRKAPGQYRTSFSAVKLTAGACRTGQVLRGDGKASAMVELVCEKGLLAVDYSVDPKGRLTSLKFSRSPASACQP